MNNFSVSWVIGYFVFLTDAVTQLKLPSEFLYLLTSGHKAEDKLPDRQLLKVNTLCIYLD
jgi:hypothetical protein